MRGYLRTGTARRISRRSSGSRRPCSRARAMADRPPFYLPDFCRAQSVLAVILIAALVAVLFTLARQGITATFWTELAQVSLFLLWATHQAAAVPSAAQSRNSDCLVRGPGPLVATRRARR